VMLSPASVQFGSQAVGTKSSPRQIRLTNDGKTPLKISSIKLTGSDPGDFASTNNCGGQVPPESGCIIDVTFAPLKEGSRDASISVSDDGGASPQLVPVSGTGS